MPPRMRSLKYANKRGNYLTVSISYESATDSAVTVTFTPANPTTLLPSRWRESAKGRSMGRPLTMRLPADLEDAYQRVLAALRDNEITVMPGTTIHDRRFPKRDHDPADGRLPDAADNIETALFHSSGLDAGQLMDKIEKILESPEVGFPGPGLSSRLTRSGAPASPKTPPGR